MVTIADRGLRYLRVHRLGMPAENVEHGAAPMGFFANEVSAYAIGVTGALHLGLNGLRVAVHEDRHADGAVIADHGDLCRLAALGYVQHRYDRAGREIQIVRIRFAQQLLAMQFDRLQMQHPTHRVGSRQAI